MQEYGGGAGGPPGLEHRANELSLRVLDPAVTRVFHKNALEYGISTHKKNKLFWTGA